MKPVIIILSALLLPVTLMAQLTIQGGSIFMQNGSIFTVDSLILQPQQDLSIGNTTITHTNTPATLSNGQTISHIYEFSDPVTFSGFVQLKYADAQLNGNNAPDLQLVYSSTNSPVTWVVTSGSIVNVTNHTVMQNVFNTALAKVSASDNNQALPLTLLYFKAEKTGSGQHALLSWSTAHPENCKLFELERSTDAQNFEPIAHIAVGPENDYRYIDKKPEANWNFYRLKIIGFDNELSYSPIRQLRFEVAQNVIQAYPNPFSASVTIHTRDEGLMGMQGMVINATGTLIQRFSITGNSTTLNAGQWAAGTYIIKLNNGQSFKLEKL